MNLVDKLLRVDVEKAKEPKKGVIQSQRLEDLTGEGTIEIQELNPKTLGRYQAMMIDNKGNPCLEKKYDLECLICKDGISNIDFGNEELMKHFGVPTPAELVAAIFKNEATGISDAIIELGEAPVTIEQVKN